MKSNYCESPEEFHKRMADERKQSEDNKRSIMRRLHPDNGLWLTIPEQAIKLALLGFDWPTEKKIGSNSAFWDFDTSKLHEKGSRNGSIIIPHPPIELALKWLRATKICHIEICFHRTTNTIPQHWTGFAHIFRVGEQIYTANFLEYEDAADDLLSTIIEYLFNKKTN